MSRTSIVCSPEISDVYGISLPSFFLGGSISGARDWQKEVIDSLKDEEIILYNPRRQNFDTSDRTMEKKQIAWEWRYLRIADGLMFWFSGETLAPITLFELGRHSGYAGRPLFVGCDPGYKRKRDVQIQMSLVRPDVVVESDVSIIIENARKWSHWFATQ